MFAICVFLFLSLQKEDDEVQKKGTNVIVIRNVIYFYTCIIVTINMLKTINLCHICTYH
jgi:hypothetical protein